MMKTFRFTDNDAERLEEITKKVLNATKKEGVTQITKTTILRSLILMGNDSHVDDVIEKVKKLKLYG